MPIRKPSYRFHNARKCAVVTVNGKDHYLGSYDSPESWEKYHRIIAGWLATRNLPPASPEATAAPLTIAELLLAYWNFAKSYYVKDGQPTSEQDTVRQAMAEHTITRKFKMCNPETGEVKWQEKVLRQGLARRFINKQISRIKRVFAWAVEEELLPVGVHAALLRVKGLKKGKSVAREKPRIKPVAAAQVEAVLPHVPPVVKAMILIQRLCGGRPQDVVQMRTADIDMNGAVWEYRPRRHKTEGHTQIATIVDLPSNVIETYEALFFNCRDRLNATDWIVVNGIGNTMASQSGGLDRGVMLKSLAYFGGPMVLEAVLPYLTGTKDPFEPVADLSTPKARSEQSVRLAVAAHMLLQDTPKISKTVHRTLSLLLETAQERLFRDAPAPPLAQIADIGVEELIAAASCADANQASASSPATAEEKQKPPA